MSKIIVLSWHPGSSKFKTAGGFHRAYEIFKRSKASITILDKHPSLFLDVGNPTVKVIEYPGLHTDSVPIFGKVLDRLLSPLLIVHAYFKNRGHENIIYVPYSELPQLTLAGVVIKFLTGARLVLCNLNPNSFVLDRLVNNFMHRFSDRTITISGSLSNQLKAQGIKAEYINGVGFNLPKASASSKKVYDAVFIGRHTPEKGIIDLLKIWNLLVNEQKAEVKLVTVGEIPAYMKSEINELVDKYKLSKHITFKGPVSESEKTRTIQNSRICVFPSRQEGWGIVPMETLSLGLPVIAYNLPVYADSVGSTGAFVTVNTGDIQSFARQFLTVLQNLSHYSQLAKNWRPKHTWESIAKKEFEIICG